MKVISAITILIGLLALWTIRGSWRLPWERPAAINLACQTFKLIVVLPVCDYWLSSKLHTLTGVWNIQELLGHLGYMFGMLCILYLVVSRLDMTADQFQSYVRYRIELPGTLVMACMVAVFIAGPGKHDMTDLVTAQVTPFLRMYWLTVAIALSFILVQATQALLILRRNPRSRCAANSYLWAVAVSAAGIVAFQLEIGWLQWVIIRLEVVAYAIAATYTWHSKQRADVPSDYLLPG